MMDALTSGSDDIQIIENGGHGAIGQLLFGMSDLDRYVFYQEKKNIESLAGIIASSHRLDRSGGSYVDSRTTILQVMHWEEFSLDSFLRMNGVATTIKHGGMHEWDRAMRSLIFHMEKIYPQKIRMIKRYVEEMHVLWNQLASAMSWDGFIKLEENLRHQ
jgi:hypothetical protein